MWSPFRTRLFVAVASLLVVNTAAVDAGKAQLKNRVVIDGEIVPVKGLTPAQIQRTQGPTETYPIVMVHAGYKRYFVPDRKVDWQHSDQSAALGSKEFFRFKRKLGNRKAGPSALGPYRILKPWTPYGRRIVKVRLSGDREREIIQGVTGITPKYVEVEGISHVWKFGLAVTSFAPETLAGFISQVTDRKNPSDRMAIVRYYIQAGLYNFASKELESLVKDFPEQKKNAEEARFQLRQLTAKQIIGELKRRRLAGQHRLVYASCRKFPKKDVTAAVLRDIEQIKREYEDARAAAEKALTLLMDLESQLKDPKVLAAVKPMRSEIAAKLDFESLPRLDAFLKLSGDKTLPAADKLALAYTGWILGSGHADTKLDVAIHLWEARFLMMNYLRSDNALTRNEIIKQLKKLESVKPEFLGHMVPYLAPILETPEAKPGRPLVLTVAGRNEKPAIRYAVLLPPEYNPHHRYPTVVALHPAGRTAVSETEWWGGNASRPGQAQRHGYLVIAPEYTDGKTPSYDYSAQAHEAVIESLRDARKRFQIDSDRVFLSGHGSGGDAAFDIAMSHPDLFAGCMPIVGVIDKFCIRSFENARLLPWYIVSGELARNSLARNASVLTNMMTKSDRRIPGSTVFDVVYCEYIGRGYESYYEEIHQLFDWMSLQTRRKFPKRIDAQIQRPSENRFWWVHCSGFPKNVTHSTVLAKNVRRTQPMPFRARITTANAVMINSGANAYSLWLSPDMVDYSRPVTVRLSHVARRLFHGLITREIDTMLEDLRVRGDRQKLYWTRLNITRGGLNR